MDVNQLFAMLDQIPVTDENEKIIQETREALEEGNYQSAIEKINQLYSIKLNGNPQKNEYEEEQENERTYDNEEKQDEEANMYEEEEKEGVVQYPKELVNEELEETYIGLLLNNPKALSMYYVVFENCYFQNPELLNIYKSILFTEGQAYAPEVAKRGYNFAKETQRMFSYKEDLKDKYQDTNYNFEKVYVEIQKLFVLRKNYLGMLQHKKKLQK